LKNNNNNNNKTTKQSSYSKSLQGLNSFKEKRKMLSLEFAAFRKKCNKSTSPQLFRSTSINTSFEKFSDSPTANPAKTTENNVVVISPRKIIKSLSPTPLHRVVKAVRTKSTELTHASSLPSSRKEKDSSEVNQSENGKQQTRGNPVTLSKSKTEKMDLEHQRMMRAKKIASEALKVLLCELNWAGI